MESYLLTHFQSKSCTNLSETEFWHTKKMSTETKIFKKCHLRDRNDRISLKNDKSPGESFSLTYFQSKICTNLTKIEFCRKKKNHRNENLKKKSHFRGRNDGVWPKDNEPPLESWPLTHFQLKSFTNFRESGAKTSSSP